MSLWSSTRWLFRTQINVILSVLITIRWIWKLILPFTLLAQLVYRFHWWNWLVFVKKTISPLLFQYAPGAGYPKMLFLAKPPYQKVSYCSTWSINTSTCQINHRTGQRILKKKSAILPVFSAIVAILSYWIRSPTPVHAKRNPTKKLLSGEKKRNEIVQWARKITVTEWAVTLLSQHRWAAGSTTVLPAIIATILLKERLFPRLFHFFQRNGSCFPKQDEPGGLLLPCPAVEPLTKPTKKPPLHVSPAESTYSASCSFLKNHKICMWSLPYPKQSILLVNEFSHFKLWKCSSANISMMLHSFFFSFIHEQFPPVTIF